MTYRCIHCHRDIHSDDGADDAIERAVGPICDDCASFDASRVIVCGGREYGAGRLRYKSISARALDAGRVDRQRARLYEVLSAIQPGTIAHGSGRGADQRAKFWAHDYGVDQRHFPADWETHGKAAGPIRNQRMLDEFKPTLVVAFPGGRGTADMVRRARKAGVQVLEVKDDK